MAIDWGRYQRGDWRMQSGKSKRYINRQTGEEISRRQFDQHYGSAAAYGTIDKRAKYNAAQGKNLLRPARGRSSALKLTEAEKIVERSKRKVQKAEKLADKKINSEINKKRHALKRITLSNFKTGKISRNIELPVEYDAIVETIRSARDSKIVFGYFVGANLITDMGEDRTFTATRLRSISMGFTREEFDDMIDEAMGLTYARLVSLFVHLSLKIEVARSRNKWRKKK
jgi:hypothetical protein